MRYAIVLPVFNEQQYLPSTLVSIAQQTLQPALLVIVDDGSTDTTPTIAADFAAKYDYVKIITKEKKTIYRIGGTVVENFNAGYQLVDTSYEFVVKLDADITLPPHYFERIASHFQNNPKLGIAGGKQLMLQGTKWVYEPVGDPDHVKGPCKSYRRACLEAMHGLRSTIGWDSADEMLARYYGWEVMVDEKLQIQHHRLTGTNTGQWMVRRRIGHGFYRIRYGFWVSAFSAAKAAIRSRPYLLSGIAILVGYLEAWWRKDDYKVSEEEGRYLRQYRWSRLLGKFGLGKIQTK